MRDYHIQYGGAAYALPGEPARRLYATGDGDAALLYLYLMCHGGTAEPAQAAIDLRMSAERYDAAVRTLAGVGAIAALEPDPQADKTTQPKPPKKSATSTHSFSSTTTNATSRNASNTPAGTPSTCPRQKRSTTTNCRTTSLPASPG